MTVQDESSDESENESVGSLGLCTTIAVKGAIRRCGRESEYLVGVGFMLIAYHKDLNGNMY